MRLHVFVPFAQMLILFTNMSFSVHAPSRRAVRVREILGCSSVVFGMFFIIKPVIEVSRCDEKERPEMDEVGPATDCGDNILDYIGRSIFLLAARFNAPPIDDTIAPRVSKHYLITVTCHDNAASAGAKYASVPRKGEKRSIRRLALVPPYMNAVSQRDNVFKIGGGDDEGVELSWARRVHPLRAYLM